MVTLATRPTSKDQMHAGDADQMGQPGLQTNASVRVGYQALLAINQRGEHAAVSVLAAARVTRATAAARQRSSQACRCWLSAKRPRQTLPEPTGLTPSASFGKMRIAGGAPAAEVSWARQRLPADQSPR